MAFKLRLTEVGEDSQISAAITSASSSVLTRGSDCIDDAEVLCPFGIECAAGDQEFTGDVDRKRARSPKRVRRTSQPDRVWFREGRIALWQRRRSDRRPVRFRNRHQARSPRLQRSGACSAGAE